MNTTTRRTLMKGAAWSAPAVAVSTAAPALAASPTPCTPIEVTVDWHSAQYTRVSSTSGYYTISLSDDTTLRMDIKSSFSGGMRAGGVAGDGVTDNDNLRLSQFPIGGTGQPGLVLHQNDYYYPRYKGCNGVQTVTFTFDRPVSTLDFAVTDIDAAKGDFSDAVSLSTNLTATPKAGVTGSYYNGATWYKSTYYSPVNNASGSNNLVAHGENITSFQVKYANWDQYSTGADRDQRVFLTDFDITIPPTGC